MITFPYNKEERKSKAAVRPLVTDGLPVASHRLGGFLREPNLCVWELLGLTHTLSTFCLAKLVWPEGFEGGTLQGLGHEAKPRQPLGLRVMGFRV